MKRTGLGIVIIFAVVGALVFSRLLANKDSEEAIEVFKDNIATDKAEPTTNVDDKEAPPLRAPKPELVNLDGWLQSDATGINSFDGQVRIVQFWTFGCFNCNNTYPFLKEIYQTYEPEGLEIIGVHAPEFDWEKDPIDIQNAAKEKGITWPIALDTNKENFKAWRPENRGWPLTYVLDQNGNVRYERKGEKDYERLTNTVKYLIENGP